MDTNGGDGGHLWSLPPPSTPLGQKEGITLCVSEHSGSCTDGGAVSGPGFRSLGGSRVVPRRGTAAQPTS